MIRQRASKRQHLGPDIITFFFATSLPTIVISSRASYSPASSSSAPDPFPLSLPSSSRKITYPSLPYLGLIPVDLRWIITFSKTLYSNSV